MPLRKGYHHSEETRKKISMALKGKMVGEKNPMWRKINPMLGRKHRRDSIEKMRLAALGKYEGERNPFFGRKHTQEFKDRLRRERQGIHVSKETEFKPGEKHLLWNGGSSLFPYPFSFSKKLKIEIKERDGFACVLCGRDDVRLDIHHIDYNKNNCLVENLISLCRSCHSKTNRNRRFWINLFKNKTQQN